MSSNGNYWSAGANNENNATQLNFNSDNVNPLNNNNRANGFSVRPCDFGLDYIKLNYKMNLDKIYSRLSQAYLDARKNERNKPVQQKFEISLTKNLHNLSREIYNRTWKPSPLVSFMIDKPTYREIFAPNFRDEIISHFLFNLINPVIEKKFIYDTYSCRKGKGTLFGIKRFTHHLLSETNNYKDEDEVYVLSIDISGYFMSIDKNILKKILYKHLHKHPEFDLIKFLIDAILDRDPLENCRKIGNLELWKYLPANKSLFNSPPGVGLIIGDVISQLFSNIYLNELDQYCKRELKCKHYCRYVDDIRIISKDKLYLESLIPKINTFLRENLHLTLHPRKTKIESTTGTFTFLGASIKKYRMHALKRTINNFKEYVKSIKYDKINLEDVLSHINSYLGYFSHFNDYKTVDKIITKTRLNEFFEFAPRYKKAKIVSINKIIKMKSDKKDWILVGSSYFFSCYPEFVPKDQDWVELVENPKEFKTVMQISGKFCLFRWRLMKPQEFIEYTLANNPAMMLGKFLVPEVCEKIGFGLEDLRKLEPVSLRLDPKHQYEKIIFDSYMENGDFTLTPEQRLQAYEIYKKARNI